jgi:hypothetical protein
LSDPDPTPVLVAAAERLAAAQTNRHRPSPSSTSRCTRANWFSETGVPPTETPDAESYMAAESGRMTEELMISLVNESGLARIEPLTEEERELTPNQLKLWNLRGGQIDQLGFIMVDKEEDDLVLVEFKRKSAWQFLKIARGKDIRETDTDIFQQVQLLLAALRLQKCLLVVVNWDRATLTRMAGKGGRPSGIYGEWVYASNPAALVAAKRAKMQGDYIDNETKASRVPRDYDPLANKFPCTWCPWLTACLGAEGIKRQPGRVGG